MKQLLSLALILIFSVLLLSWGALGHRTVAIITERHLSPKAKAAIQNLLGNESLTEASTWADEIRGQSEYHNTGPWHYINLPTGLSRSEFDRQVTGMTQPNVYEALSRMEQNLLNPSTNREQKIEALKFIVHFVGDAHQPMHVSRAEDQGGNKVQVNYEGRGTNLHALWDSWLLEHEGLSESELANKIDHATPTQIKQWQQDPLLQWLWESYGVSSQLYAEVEQLKKRTITDDYYKAHIPIIEDRLEKAGIRLAGVLNQIFEGSAINGTVIPPPPVAKQGQPSPSIQVPKQISIESVGSHIDEVVSVCGKVYGFKDLKSMVLVNLGADYPNQLLTVVLRGQTKSLEVKTGQNICATGKVEMYKGKPEIVVTDSSMIAVK